MNVSAHEKAIRGDTEAGALSRFLLGASNVDSVDKYGWAENCGWTNWRDANAGAEGVNVGFDFLSGFIWNENTGYINVGDGTPTNGIEYANTDGAPGAQNSFHIPEPFSCRRARLPDATRRNHRTGW